MANSFPCPRCRRPLPSQGTVKIGAEKLRSYQCDHCLVLVDLFGAKHEAALTFCVDDKGRPFDPASPDGSLPPPVSPA